MGNPNTENEVSTRDALEAAMKAMESGEKTPEPEKLEFEERHEQEHEAEAVATEQQAPVVEQKAQEEQVEEKTQQKAAQEEQAGEESEESKEGEEEEVTAPSSWRAEARAHWKDVPVDVQREIQKRETDFHKGVAQYKEYAQVGRTMEAAITPYLANIKAAGVPVDKAISNLLKTESLLRNGDPVTKAQTFVKMAQEYGIDVNTLANVPKPDPAVMALQKRLEEQEEALRVTQERDSQAITSEIERFRSDPANVHFDVVRDDMALLLSNNRARDLSEAYKMAVWMRPELRQPLVEKQRTEASKQVLDKQQAKRAQAAAAGIKGSRTPVNGSLKPGASIRDILNAAMDNA